MTEEPERGEKEGGRPEGVAVMLSADADADEDPDEDADAGADPDPDELGKEGLGRSDGGPEPSPGDGEPLVGTEAGGTGSLCWSRRPSAAPDPASRHTAQAASAARLRRRRRSPRVATWPA
ncbi:hypothetical protein ABZ726_24215, partial [Streptomyces hundungensis]